ncbi:MAG: SDR family oxidoreductase [Methanomicrobiales archaeon]|nr:SDR family oxidoreductase [Methanomicrobiales archaeon]
MRYAVTGGAGFIGSHLARALLPAHEVVIVDDLSSGKKSRIERLHASGALTLFKGSVTDRSLLARAFEGVDGIFHLAALVSVPRSVAQPLLSHEVNLTGTLNALIAARESGVERFVFASSSAVYGESEDLPLHEALEPLPASPYAVTKVGGEQYCRLFSSLYGLSTVSLRYFNVFGPEQDPSSMYAAVIPAFIGRLLAGERPVVHGDGLQTRDFVYVKDVVAANLLAMRSRSEGTFNIGSGRATSILELLHTIRQLTSARVKPHHGPPREGDVRHSVADISRAARELGFSPAYTLEEGLRETIAWFREHHRSA